jgi:hypothetical protein
MSLGTTSRFGFCFLRSCLGFSDVIDRSLCALSASDSFVDILHDLWIDIWCNVIKPSHMPSCSFLFCAFDRMRNPSNESWRKVHIALGCSYQQFQLSFLFSIGQVARKCRDFQAILESMITSSKVGVLC